MPESPPVRPLSLATAKMRPTPALRLGLHECSPIVFAGLRLVLEPHADRVRLRPAREDSDVILVDAAHRCGPPRLPAAAAPLVVLVREGDLAAARLTRQGGGSPVAITAPPETLVQAVESAYRASRSPHRHGLHAVAPEKESATELLHPLSAREEQVVSGVCAGLSNEDIAAELYVSINSVKTYIRSAYRKMGVTRRGQAVVWGMQRGYGEPVAATRTP